MSSPRHSSRPSAPFPAARTASAKETAQAALRRLRLLGETSPEVTTPERLLQAAGRARVEAFSRPVEVERDGRAETETAEAYRIRIDDGPIARLRARNLLAVGPDAAVRNALLAAAAARYRQHWYLAGLYALNAIDFMRERVSGGTAGLLRTERQVTHFKAYGAAVASLSTDARRVVDAVVLRDRELVDIGREFSGYKQEKQATAVALYVLRSGLQALAKHFGLMVHGG